MRPWLICPVLFGIAASGVVGQPSESGSADSSTTQIATTQSGIVASQPTSQPHSSRPFVSEVDLKIIADYARRAFRAKVLDLPEMKAKFCPLSLEGSRGIIHLTLRKNGGARAESESDEMPIVEAAVAAGTLLGQASKDAKLELPDGGDDFGLDLEWLGPVEYIAIPPYENGQVWTDALVHAFEPGVEGIGVEFRGKRGWSRPSLVYTHGYTADLALAAAERMIDLRGIQKVRFPEQIKYFRFWTYHLWQPNAKAQPVELCRGDTLVLSEAVSKAGLDAAIERIGRYLIYRQLERGDFSHEFISSSGIYRKGNSGRIQLRALEGMASLFRSRGDAESAEHLKRGIEAFKKHLEPLVVQDKKPDGTEYPKQVGLALAPVGHSGVLELSSRFLTAISWNKGESSLATERAGLIDGLLSSQSESGVIALASEQSETPGGEIQVNDTDCCRAILALCRAHAEKPDARIPPAVARAIRYYQGRSLDAFEPRAAAALMRAVCLHYADSNDVRESDLAFVMADRFVSLQLGERNCPYPELWGAINVARLGEVGADSAIYLSALCDALQLAGRIGDRIRVDSYRAAVTSAARFILQLEVREMGCYFIRGKMDALGGIRSAPWSSRLRIDWTALGLESLIDARAALFDENR